MSTRPAQTEIIQALKSEEKKKSGIFGIILLLVLAFLLGALPIICLGEESENEPSAGGFAPPAPQIITPQNTAPHLPAPPPELLPEFTPVNSAATGAAPIVVPAAITPPKTVPAASTAPYPVSNFAPVNNPQINRQQIKHTPPVNPNTNTGTAAKKRNEFRQPEIVPAVAAEPSPEQLKNQPELLRSVADEQHPFRYYYDVPKHPQSLITGKLIPVSEILDGVSSSAVRCRLLQKYWELAGLLVEYNVRLDAEMICQKWLNESGGDAQRRSVFSLVLNQTQQQRKSAELTFIKTQWCFAEMLNPYRQNITEKDNLPLPSDFPVYKKYETYSGKIARSERAVLLGHLIPVQEQLLGSKKEESKAADAMIQNTMQQPQSSPRDLIFTLNQRTEAFCGLIAATVDYNKMIAEYVSETVNSGVSKYRLVGAVIELPKWNNAPKQ